MGTYIPLKYYFDAKLAERLASLILPYYSLFNQDLFVERVSERVEEKELKERVAIIAEELFAFLPEEYDKALPILLAILGPENETEAGMFTNGYFLMPVAKFVETYGLNHFDLSMKALYELTKRHTSEYAIRPYLLIDTQRCLLYLNKWKNDSNFHVRRLVSEGTRPRLPWAKKMALINGDIYQNLTLLDALKNDSSGYVLKSVGNHLNDLTKDEPEIVLVWISERIENIHPIILKKGLRTLVKQENEKAQELLHRYQKGQMT